MLPDRSVYPVYHNLYPSKYKYLQNKIKYRLSPIANAVDGQNYSTRQKVCIPPSLGKRAVCIVGVVFHVFAGIDVDVEQIDAALCQSMRDVAIDNVIVDCLFVRRLEPIDFLEQVSAVRVFSDTAWQGVVVFYVVCCVFVQLFLLPESSLLPAYTLNSGRLYLNFPIDFRFGKGGIPVRHIVLRLC